MRSSRHPGNASNPTGVNVARGGGAGALGAAGGATWQAVNAAAKARRTARNRTRSEHTMEWVLLESLLALAILIGIVWWTMTARHKPDDRPTRKRDSSHPDEE
jgi:hypothetical protein